MIKNRPDDTNAMLSGKEATMKFNQIDGIELKGLGVDDLLTLRWRLNVLLDKADRLIHRLYVKEAKLKWQEHASKTEGEKPSCVFSLKQDDRPGVYTWTVRYRGFVIEVVHVPSREKFLGYLKGWPELPCRETRDDSIGGDYLALDGFEPHEGYTASLGWDYMHVHDYKNGRHLWNLDKVVKDVCKTVDRYIKGQTAHPKIDTDYIN